MAWTISTGSPQSVDYTIVIEVAGPNYATELMGLDTTMSQRPTLTETNAAPRHAIAVPGSNSHESAPRERQLTSRP